MTDMQWPGDPPEDKLFREAHVTDPSHGGKVTCHKCGSFIQRKDWVPYRDRQHKTEFANYHFHRACYNDYEHYYGIDKPID